MSDKAEVEDTEEIAGKLSRSEEMRMREPVEINKVCPIESKIGAVFVPVTDMNRSVIWYKKLLDHPLDPKFVDHEKSEERTVYSIELGETTLLLDSMNRDELKASPSHRGQGSRRQQDNNS